MTRLQGVDAITEVSDDTRERADQDRQSTLGVGFSFTGPWFTSREAAAYIPCKSLKSYYMWRGRHGLIPRNNGSVAKADLDRILRRRKPKRVMAATSLANLQKRRA